MNFLDPRLPERFWSKVSPEPNSGCWLWAASGSHGYGRFPFLKSEWLEKRGELAHRHAYKALVGPIPDGLELDHLCRVRCCVNPAHLEPVSHAENVRRGNSGSNTRSKTHCPQGHPYEGDNLRIGKNGKYLARYCIACTREAGRKRNARLQAQRALARIAQVALASLMLACSSPPARLSGVRSESMQTPWCLPIVWDMGEVEMDFRVCAAELWGCEKIRATAVTSSAGMYGARSVGECEEQEWW